MSVPGCLRECLCLLPPIPPHPTPPSTPSPHCFFPVFQVRARVDEVLAQVDLTERFGDLVGTPGTSGLPTEARKRLTIAVELMANPPVLFMDEPTSGEPDSSCYLENVSWLCGSASHAFSSSNKGIYALLTYC